MKDDEKLRQEQIRHAHESGQIERAEKCDPSLAVALRRGNSPGQKIARRERNRIKRYRRSHFIAGCMFLAFSTVPFYGMHNGGQGMGVIFLLLIFMAALEFSDSRKTPKSEFGSFLERHSDRIRAKHGLSPIDAEKEDQPHDR